MPWKQDLRPLQGAGLEALSDRSRRPVRYANQLPAQIESLIVRLKREKPHWGARKIRELLVSAGSTAMSAFPPRAPSTPCSTATAWSSAPARPRHRATGTPLSPGARAQRSVVRRLQGRVQARQRAILLPADRHRPRLALPAAVRGPRIDPRGPRHHRLRAAVPRARPAAGHPLRQRRALRQPQRPVQPLQALGLVAPARHRHRAHQARPPAAERPPRAHAPHPQEGSHPAAGHEQPAAAGALRRLRPASSIPSGRTRRSP